MGCQGWIRIAVGSLGVHIDQPHLDGGKRVIELALTSVAIVSEHNLFGTPIHHIGLPVIFTTTGEAKGFKAHVLHGNGASQNHEVSPGDLSTILLLDGPHKASRLVEVSVIRPAIEWLKALLASTCASATVGDSISPRTVPCHPDKEGTVVAIVCWPPVFGIG